MRQYFFIQVVKPRSGLTEPSEASATLFPVGWSVKDRIGWTVAQLHRLVPTWEERLSLSVERWDHVRTDQDIQG